jgi:hypothetical protein
MVSDFGRIERFQSEARNNRKSADKHWRQPRRGGTGVLPAFADEAAERRFWESHDLADYVDWGNAERVRMPRLKPTSTAISLRLPVPRIKVATNQRDVPYQSPIKTWLAEKIGET